MKTLIEVRTSKRTGQRWLLGKMVAFLLGVLMSASIPAVEIGETAPSFTIESLNSDETVSLGDFKGKVVILDFWASWCGPCKALKPVMDKLSDEYKDKAGFYYADIEDGGINTGSAAGIRGVPTVIIYKKGVEVDRKVGGVPESHMKEFLDKNI